MLKRDYLLKLIQDVFDAIAKLLEREGQENERQKAVEALYNTFGESVDYFRSATEEELVSKVIEATAEGSGVDVDLIDERDVCKRLELLAYLMYADFKISAVSDEKRRDIALRALVLYMRVCESSDTYLRERLGRIEELNRYLEKWDR